MGAAQERQMLVPARSSPVIGRHGERGVPRYGQRMMKRVDTPSRIHHCFATAAATLVTIPTILIECGCFEF
jgi:hypothetical protein